MKRAHALRAVCLACIAWLLAHGVARADDPLPEPPPAPPPEWEEPGDYEMETPDSLAGSEVEVGLGATGREGSRARRSRSLRFRGDGLSGSVRNGSGDPLAGTLLDGRAAGGWFSVGTLAPRWGRGLVLGTGADPWSLRARDRGADAPVRGRSGDGARFQSGGPLQVETLGGRFARRDLGGVRVGFGPAALGLIGGRGGARQWSAGLAGESSSAEFALGSDRRWRAEAGAARGLGAWRLEGFVRGGHQRFASIAEPRRAGPARAATLAIAHGGGRVQSAAIASLWRFAPGLAGARAALELRMPLAHHGALALGLEEQHGTRTRPASAAAIERAGRFRQGAWGEWSGSAAGLGLTLRHEAWGEERWARHAVRTVSACRVELAAPLGLRLAVAQTAYRVESGETLYLADAEGSRTVLRALTGGGDRTRLELGSPAGGGMLRAALNLTQTRPQSRAQWTLDWTRRARSGGARPRASP